MSAEAIAEATEVQTEAAMTPVGELYEQALAKEHAKEETPPTPTPEPKKAIPEKAEEKAEPAKPESALEAALAETPEEKKSADPLSELPETLPNENRKDHWAKARAAIKSLSEEKTNFAKTVQELEAKLGQAKENPEVKATVEKLQAENAELRDAITAANVELLPEFRSKYIDGAKALVTKAQDKIKAYGGDPELLSEALRMPEGRRRDAAIKEAMGEDFDDLARTKVNNIIAEYDKLQDDAQAERANSQQSYERLTTKQKEQLAAQQQEAESRKAATFDAVTKKITSEVKTARLVDPTLAGAEEWNAGVNEDTANAQKLFGPDATPEMTVATAILGTRYPRLEKMYVESRAEISQLKKQLAEYQEAEPDLKGQRGAPKSDPREMDPGERYNDALAKAQPD